MPSCALFGPYMGSTASSILSASMSPVSRDISLERGSSTINKEDTHS